MTPHLSFLYTVRSFVELVRHTFQIPGVTSFLSRNICQDPLERFFGCQRQIGGTNNNPNVKEFEQNTQMLRVANFCHDIVKGNCRGNADLEKNRYEHNDDSLPLPKRRKTTSSNQQDTIPVQHKQKQQLISTGNNSFITLIIEFNYLFRTRI